MRLKEYIDTEYFNNFLETTFIRFPKNLIHCNNFQKIEKMILIADSGSTKTDWCLADETQTIAFKTAGINPFFQTDDEIRKILSREVLERLPVTDITEVFFYGAGCATPIQCQMISGLLRYVIGCDQVEVNSDLLGAARALCGHESGIACILGTGSNSCYYNGKNIEQHVSPLGFILGDEGSGAYLGKRFISDCLKGQLPEILRNGLLEKLNLTVPEILDKVYRQPEANRFLASLTTYIHEHKDMPQIHTFLLDCFGEFFRRNVMPYHRSLPVSFVGSIAWFFHDELTETANSYNIPLGIFIKNPISELIQYHFRIPK